jgi:hypothetical protein
VPGPVSLLETAHALKHIARPADGLAVIVRLIRGRCLIAAVKTSRALARLLPA